MSQVQEKTRINTYLSKRYRVVFWNDDKTTFDFVASCLVLIFGKTPDEAIRLTIDVDRKGKCIAGGGYILDVAKTKQREVLDRASEEGLPFQVTVEEE